METLVLPKELDLLQHVSAKSNPNPFCLYVEGATIMLIMLRILAQFQILPPDLLAVDDLNHLGYFL